MLAEHWSAGRFVCVGLDPQIEKIPEHLKQGRPSDTIIAFNRAIIESTCDLVAAYKPNVAFYERFGVDGYNALRETVLTIRSLNPGVPVILDAKRADIGNTNAGYVDSIFKDLAADGTTVNPYLGFEALSPFSELADKIHFVLCRTSNPGAGEFQDLRVDDQPLYMHVARHVAESWNANQNFGLVVGATSPAELTEIRTAVPTLPLLIPGVGAQGGDVAAVAASVRSAGTPNVLVNSSRGILFADTGTGFADAARRAAMDLSNALTDLLG